MGAVVCMDLTLSENTRKLLIKFKKREHFLLPSGILQAEHLSLLELNKWLSDKTLPQGHFKIEALRVSLLQDFKNALAIHSTKKPEPKKSNWSKFLKFGFLAMAGLLFAACEGFVGIVALLGLVAAPWAVLISAGILFALFSVIVFVGFDLRQISKNLGVGLFQSPVYLDLCIEELALLRDIKSHIRNTYALVDNNENNEALLAAIQSRFQEIKTQQAEYKQLKHGFLYSGSKFTLSLMIGLLFFSGGYFTGEAVALFFAGLVLASVVPTMWPVVVFSIIVGIAAFAMYWYEQRPDIENLIDQTVGLDKNKIQLYCDEGTVVPDLEEVLTIQQGMQAFTALKEQQKPEKPVHTPRLFPPSQCLKRSQSYEYLPSHDRKARLHRNPVNAPQQSSRR